jgi:hypothetical protein
MCIVVYYGYVSGIIDLLPFYVDKFGKQNYNQKQQFPAGHGLYWWLYISVSGQTREDHRMSTVPLKL